MFGLQNADCLSLQVLFLKKGNLRCTLNHNLQYNMQSTAKFSYLWGVHNETVKVRVFIKPRTTIFSNDYSFVDSFICFYKILILMIVNN